MDDQGELLTLEAAAKRLGVSRATMWRRSREWDLTIYVNPRDRREKLFRWSEIEDALKPRPLPKKEAA